ncbi:MFS transporter [Lactobacillus sp. ESL0731]|uniref:MFS transporter n=1 Tax=unclassified Lactobacillus TaxID=2620435 RepID=UPI0023F6D461|nr:MULTISPECIES: MFS transporter [unclassified Lactobacillus]WEV51017.1 MFS transporter [Lactobacillus sp. ESL0700]WEV62148.1 MFS transporter [Lactobacillus sp. ESL0731]
MGVFLKNKNYRKLSFASWLSTAGDILFYLALMTYASKLHNYTLAISLISITEAIPRLIESLSGYYADRTKNKFKMIVWLAIIRFILYLIVGLLFVTNIAGWNLILLVIGINFISDISGMYSGGLTTPLIVNLVGQNEVAEATGFTNGISQIISTVARFVGSVLLLYLSYSNLAIVNALTFLFAGLLYASVGHNYLKSHPQEDVAVNQQGFFTTLKSSFSQIKKANGLLTVISVIALLNGILMTLEPLISIVVAGNKSMLIGTYTFTIALIGAVESIGFALGSAIGTTIFKKTSLFVNALIDTIISAGTTLAIINKNIIATLIFITLLSFFAGVASPKMMQWLVSSVDRTILSSSVGALNTILQIAGPLMTAIFTSIASAIGINYALFALIIVSVIVFAIILYVMNKTKKTVANVQPAE